MVQHGFPIVNCSLEWMTNQGGRWVLAPMFCMSPLYVLVGYKFKHAVLATYHIPIVCIVTPVCMISMLILMGWFAPFESCFGEFLYSSMDVWRMCNQRVLLFSSSNGTEFLSGMLRCVTMIYRVPFSYLFSDVHVVGWACVHGRVKSCISDFAACGRRAFFSFPCAKTHSTLRFFGCLYILLSSKW